MSRVSFHESLEQIEMNLLSMGELAGTSVQRSVEALVQHDDAKAQTVIDDDDTVDALYLKIDSDVLSVLALQSPVAADLRLIFSKNHGNLASSGSVGYLFRRRGQITIPRASIEDDKLLELALDAGAEDVSADDEHHIVTTAHDRLYAVADSLRQSGVTADSQRLTFIPDTTIQLTDEAVAQQVIRLCEALEENDDVQHVYANFDVSEDLLARISG